MSTIPPPPQSVEELKRNRPKLQNTYEAHRATLTRLERIAVWITDRVGTMGFFIIIFIWTILWLGWNILAPANLQFDPPSAFVFWLFISNMIQIFLMPLIMVGQNLQGSGAELRAKHDLEVNIKAEREIEVILRHLEYQNSILLALVQKLGVDMESNATKGYGESAS